MCWLKMVILGIIIAYLYYLLTFLGNIKKKDYFSINKRDSKILINTITFVVSVAFILGLTIPYLF